MKGRPLVLSCALCRLVGVVVLVLLARCAPGADQDWPIVLKNDSLRVVVRQDLSFWVHHVGRHRSWHTRDAAGDDWMIEGEPASIRDAGRHWRRRFNDGMHEGVLLGFEAFPETHVPDDACITVFVGLKEDEPELAVSVFPGQGTARLTRATYPYPIAGDGKAPHAVVVPYNHGVLIPDDWPHNSSMNALIWSSHINMPFFGAISGNVAYLAISETPHDTALVYNHPAGNPTTIGFHSLPSMGALNYPRRFLLRFLADADYVTIAKEYRAYSRSIGRLVTLEDKSARLPKIDDLIRTFEFEAMPYEPSEDDVRPESAVRDFDARLADTAEIVDRVGPPINYYASCWKYILPGGTRISPPGGWEKMRRFVDGIHALDGLVQVYENHHLMTADSPYYTPDIAIKNAAGNEIAWRESWGGHAPAKDMRALAPALAPAFVRLKYEGMLEQGVRPDAVYQDQFAAVALYENYDPLLRNDRRACETYWGQALDTTSELGIITGTELGYDWSIPHAAFYAWIWSAGDAGIRIPLWMLVYHDCALIRDQENPPLKRLLRAYLCGYYERMTAPHGKPIPWDSEMDTGVSTEDWTRLIRRQSAFLAQIAKSEMVSHEFLDDSRNNERTEFANGIAVEANFANLTLRITGAQGFDDAWHKVVDLRNP